jgi:hypothetical protein
MPYLGLRGKNLLAAVTVSAGMGFILFGRILFPFTNIEKSFQPANRVIPGYDNGVMGSVFGSPSFEQQFHLSSTMEGTVTAMFELGCIIRAWSVSLFGEPWGRRTIIHMGTVCVCIGAAIQTSSYSIAQLIVGRIVAGTGMGFIKVVCLFGRRRRLRRQFGELWFPPRFRSCFSVRYLFLTRQNAFDIGRY